MREAVRQSRPDRVNSGEGDDRNCLSCLVGGRRSGRADRENGINAAVPHYFLRQFRERIDIPRCAPKLKTNITPFDVTKFAQELAGEFNLRRNGGRGELDDALHSRRLLRTRHKRPRYRSAEERDELASSHMTSLESRSAQSPDHSSLRVSSEWHMNPVSDNNRVECPRSVISAVLCLGQPLPVHPDQRTSSDRPTCLKGAMNGLKLAILIHGTDLSPAVTFQSVTTSALATGPVSNHTAPANSDTPQPRNARAALLSTMSTLARERPWISSLALMRRQLRHITVSSSPQRAAALDSRLAPAGCACLIELPVVQADQLLRRLIGLDGARLDPRLERPLERKRRVELAVEAETFHGLDRCLDGDRRAIVASGLCGEHRLARVLTGPFPCVPECPCDLGRGLGVVVDDRGLGDRETAIFVVVRRIVLGDEPPSDLLVLHQRWAGLSHGDRGELPRLEPLRHIVVQTRQRLPGQGRQRYVSGSVQSGCLQPMVKPHMTVQQERFDGKWKDLDRLPLEVSGGLDRRVRRDHHRPAAEVVAVDDVIVDISGHHVMKLIRVEISKIGLGEPRVGLYPEPMGSALGDGSTIVECGDASDPQAFFGEEAFRESRILAEVTGGPGRVVAHDESLLVRDAIRRRTQRVNEPHGHDDCNKASHCQLLYVVMST